MVALARESVEVEIWKGPREVSLGQDRVDEAWDRIFTERSLVIKSFNTYAGSAFQSIAPKGILYQQGTNHQMIKA